jgi:RimJ/RimL family protein N-acetyltransferase
MQASRNPKNPKRNIRIDCGKYVVRTIKPDDASDRWASWNSDPGAVETLNTRSRTLSKSDLLQYIRSFDQWSHWLLGIFEKQTRTHVGIIRIDVDYATNRSHVAVLIGEAAYRNSGATADVFMSCLDYVFETVGLTHMTASILSRNQVTMDYLLKAGWKLASAQAKRVRSNSHGAPLDLHNMVLTREAWREWRKTGVASRLMRRIERHRGHAEAAQ